MFVAPPLNPSLLGLADNRDFGREANGNPGLAMGTMYEGRAPLSSSVFANHISCRVRIIFGA